APFRDRFLIRERLDPYPVEELVQICTRAARLLGVPMDDAAAQLLAGCARGTPRVAQRFLRRVRDVAQVEGGGTITTAVAERGLAMLGVDTHGLEELDRRLLAVLIEGGGQPVGLKTLAVRIGEPEDTLEEVYEPFLIRRGLMQRTPRGRIATQKAVQKAVELYGPDAPDAGRLF
ncbi:MAG: Holliday junction DNA helicase RuvB C-terminal domain-containing protein, partial [Planctomycetota bacterium]